MLLLPRQSSVAPILHGTRGTAARSCYSGESRALELRSCLERLPRRGCLGAAAAAGKWECSQRALQPAPFSPRKCKGRCIGNLGIFCQNCRLIGQMLLHKAVSSHFNFWLTFLGLFPVTTDRYLSWGNRVTG